MNPIDPKIFKSYDIRGIYPSQINEENVVTITQAIYAFFLEKTGKSSLTLALGYDMRTSGPSLYPIIRQTLVDAGAHVVDLGLISTPSFYFSVFHYNYETGIQLTASHNPADWTGMKFVMNSPEGLIKIGKPTGMDDIKEAAVNHTYTLPASEPGTVEVKADFIEEEVKEAMKVIGNPEIKAYKVVADTANAMGAQYINGLFSHIPGELIKMNFEYDGTFPAHQPDPLQAKNLVDLQKKVLEEQADFGLAPDGDGDRMFFIDEKGQIVPPTLITSLIATEILEKNPGATILVDIRYILTSKKIIEELGGTFGLTKVGHAFITEQMNRTGALFGGESSAHYFYKSNGNAESQLTTILFVLKALSEQNIPLSELVEKYRRSYESGEINFSVENAPEILAAIKEKYQDGELNDMDGIAISYPDWRMSVRTSNTEPLLRLNVEAYEKAVMEEKRDEVEAAIKAVAKEIPGGTH